MSYETLKGNPANHYAGFICTGDKWNPCPVCNKGFRQWHDDGESKIRDWEKPWPVGGRTERAPDSRIIGSEYKTYEQIFKL